MEIVLTLLAVTLLIVLPVAFLLLMVWGLFHGISRAFRGERREDAPSAGQGSPLDTSREAGLRDEKAGSPNGSERGSERGQEVLK